MYGYLRQKSSRLNGLFGGPGKEKKEKKKVVSRPNIGMRPRTGSLKNPSYLHKILGNVSSSSTRPVSSASSSTPSSPSFDE